MSRIKLISQLLWLNTKRSCRPNLITCENNTMRLSRSRPPCTTTRILVRHRRWLRRLVRSNVRTRKVMKQNARTERLRRQQRRHLPPTSKKTLIRRRNQLMSAMALLAIVTFSMDFRTLVLSQCPSSPVQFYLSYLHLFCTASVERRARRHTGIQR